MRLRRGIGMEHQLDDARAIAQVDEGGPAVVAPAVHPPGHARRRARALGGELTAPRVAIAVRSWSVLHGSRPPRRIVGITSLRPSSCCSPDSMSLRLVGWAGS